MSDIEAIAFDKDGVIFDTEAQYQQSLIQIAQEKNVTIPASVMQAIKGLAADKTYALIKEAVGEQYDGDEFIRYWQQVRGEMQEKEGVPFIPGVESLIESLYALGYPLALVTSDSMDGLLFDVNRMRPDLLKYFSVVITLDDVENEKPNPEPYLRAAALLGVDAEKMLVIEDSNTGATAAIRAGAQVLLLAHNNQISDYVNAHVARRIKQHRDVLDYLK